MVIYRLGEERKGLEGQDTCGEEKKSITKEFKMVASVSMIEKIGNADISKRCGNWRSLVVGRINNIVFMWLEHIARIGRKRLAQKLYKSEVDRVRRISELVLEKIK